MVSNLPIFIFILVVLFQDKSTPSTAVDFYFEACRRPMTCGDNQTIQFPFYIQNLQQSFCGHPGFQLKCHQNGHPILHLAGRDFSVRSISYEEHSLRLSDHAVSSAAECSPLIRNLSVSANKQFRLGAGQDGICGGEESRDEAERNGLVVEWTAGECRFCNESRGFCGFDESTYLFKCYCPDRPHAYHCTPLPDSFKNKLGQGGFSSVYKGKLPDGCEVAVKLLNECTEHGEDFMNEVVSITRTSHVNIVNLLGFCYEQRKRALVYEYMPKGSLDKYIFHKGQQKENEKVLDWNMLYSIVMGVAQGLEYLHRGCNTRILHFDIKPHNILLDNEFCPKISDFGLAKQCKARESHVSMTGAKGTVGFMAPEVMFRNIGKVSHKSDVYSFGMLVLEMVGERKRPDELGVGEISKEEYFPDWIYKDLGRRGIDGGHWWGRTEEEEEMARKMIIVGLCCIQTLPEERPSMSDVVAMLEGSVDDLQIPAKPTLFGPSAIFLHPSSSSSSL